MEERMKGRGAGSPLPQPPTSLPPAAPPPGMPASPAAWRDNRCSGNQTNSSVTTDKPHTSVCTGCAHPATGMTEAWYPEGLSRFGSSADHVGSWCVGERPQRFPDSPACWVLSPRGELISIFLLATPHTHSFWGPSSPPPL